MNFLKSFIGAGILGLPYAFKKAGLAGGTFGLMIVAPFVNYGIKKLVKVDDFDTANCFSSTWL